MLDTNAPEVIQAAIVYNPFDTSDRTDVELAFQKGKSLVTYLEGLPDDVEWAVALNGIAIPSEGIAFTFPKPGDQLTVIPVPEGGGGGGDGKAILALVATVALSVFAPGIATAIVGKGASAFATKMATAAVQIAGGMLISAMIPPPETSSGTSEATYGIDGPKNTNAEGVAFPVLYGEHAVGGNYIDTYTENTTDEDGNAVQYLYIRSLLSEGPIESVDQVFINDQPMENFQEVEIDYRLGNDDQSISPWFNKTISMYNQGKELSENWLTYTTTEEVDEIRMDLVAPSGIVRHDRKGRKRHITVECEFEYSKAGENDWHPILADNIWHTPDNENEQTTSLKVDIAMNTGWFPDREGGDGRFSYDLTVEYRRFVGPFKGDWTTMKHLTGSGSKGHADVSAEVLGLDRGTYEVRVVQNGFGGDTHGTVNVSHTVKHKMPGPIRLNENTTKTIRRSYYSGQLEEAVYDVRFRRTTPDSNDESWQDTVMVSDIGEIKIEPLTLPYTAWLGAKIRLSGQLNGIPTLTAIAKGRKVLIYDHNGEVVDYRYSNNPADVALDAYMHTRYGGQIEWERIDFAAFAEWRDFCASNDLTFNGLFSDTSNIDDALKHVYIAGRAQRISSGAKLSVAIDREDTPTMMFGDGNIKTGSMEISYLPFADRINDLELAFNDKDDLYKRKAVRVTNDAALNRGEPLKSATIELKGITDRQRALREGTLRMNFNRLVKRTANWESPLEAVSCAVGDVVIVQHKMPGWGKGGRLLPASGRSTLTLDKEVTFEPGKEYRVLVHQSSYQHVGNLDITSQTGNLITLADPIEDGIKINRLISDANGYDLAVKRVVDSTTLLLDDKASDIDLTLTNDSRLVETDYVEDVTVTNPAIDSPVTTSEITVAAPLSQTPDQYPNYIFGEVQFTKKPFRIKSITRSSDSNVSITAIEYVEEVYSDDPDAQPHIYTSLTSTNHVVNLQVEEEVVQRGANNVSYAVARWEPAEDGLYTGARVQVKVNNGRFETVGDTDTTMYRFMIEQGDTITVRVVAFLYNSDQTLSVAFAPIATLTPEGVTTSSPAPTGWVGIPGVRSVTLSGPAPEVENSFSHFEIYVGPAQSTFDNARLLGRTDSSSATFTVEEGSTDARYWVVEVDTNRNRSPESEPIDVVPTTITGTEVGPNVIDTTHLVDTLGATPSVPQGLSISSSLNDAAWAVVAVAWTEVVNAVSYEVEVTRVGGGAVVLPAGETSFTFDAPPGTEYSSIRVRSVNSIGRKSEYSAAQSHTTVADDIAPGIPQNVQLTPGFNTLWAEWDRVTDADFAFYEVVHKATSAVPAENTTLTKTRTSGETAVISGLGDEETRHVFVRAVDTSGNRSDWSTIATGTTTAPVEITSETLQGIVDATSFADGITGVGVVDALPADGSEFRAVLLTTDSKIYRWIEAENRWSSGVDAQDLAGHVTADQIEAGSIDWQTLAQEVQNQIDSAGDANQSAQAAQLAQEAAEAARDAANLAETNASTAAGDAQQARDDSLAYRNAASAAQGAAETARDDAQTAATNADGSATAAAGSASAASTSSDEAGDSATAASAAQVSAEAARDDASGHASAAAQSASAASASETAAGQSAAASETSRLAAETAQGGAESARDAAATSETNAAGSASSASSSATDAANSANDAGDSATAASNSASTAATHADDASQSASAAQDERVLAQTARGQAQTSASNAAQSETNAAGSASSAATSAGNAAQSENNAGDSATAASGYASSASTAADEAGTSAEAAAASAITASTARDEAEDSATASAQSASAASASETAAGQSASAAQSSRLAAETARGGAEAARDAAATSESNAAGSASSASTSERIAARAAVAAGTRNLVTNPVGADGGAGWFNAVPSTEVPPHAPSGALSLEMRDGSRVTPPIQGDANGRVFRVKAWVRTIDCDSPVTFHMRGETPSTPGNIAAIVPSTTITAGRSVPAGQDWHEVEGIFSIDSETLVYAPAFDFGPATDRAQFYEVSFEDITESYNAGQSASAASESASAASASETAAGQEASAAQAARTAAETARSGAESAEGRAAQSATDAEGSASSASSYASDAAQSANDAGDSASAASSSASTANTRANEAEQHASAAQSARTAAETARGQAQSSAANAATSEDNAQGSAAAASSSAELAASSEYMAQNAAAQNMISDSRMIVPDAWRSHYGNDPSPYFNQDIDGGKGYENLGSRSNWWYQKQSHKIVADRTYEMRMQYRASSDSDRYYFTWSLENTNDYGSHIFPAVKDEEWQEIIFTISGSEILSKVAGDMIQFGFAANHNNGAAGSFGEVRFLEVRDITERVEAENSASAAASSASTAASEASEAGQSASSATAARNAAQTARGQAESARDAAATSETNAAGSANAASTSASNAAQSESDALGHANAASTSASTAATKASEASTSATAANSAKTAAETAKGQAETSATNAATSETNAAGSANSASSSATVAASAKNTTVMVEGNPDFSAGCEGWMSGYYYPSPDLDSTHGDIGTFEGRQNVFASTPGVARHIAQKKVWVIHPGRKYRLRGSLRVTGAGSTRMYMGVSAVDDGGYATGSNAGLIYFLSSGTMYTEADGWQDLESTVFDLNTIQTQKGADAVGVRLITFPNYNGVSGMRGLIDGIWIEDVTDSYEAGQSASAAATSASAASASETAAGQSASAAQTAKTAAETARSGAETAETNAVDAQNSAEGASATAVSAKNVAVSVRDELTLFADQQFEGNWERDGEYWAAGYGHDESELPTYPNIVESYSDANLVTAAGEGQVLRFEGVANRVMSERGLRPFVEGQKVRLRVRMRKLTGSPGLRLWLAGIDSSGVYAHYKEAYGSSATPATDSWETYEFEFEPYELRTTGNSLFVNASKWRMMLGFGYTGTNGKLEISSIQLDDVTESASVKTLQTAVSDLEGNAQAGYLIKAQAGNEVSLLELVAADGSTGSVSVAKLSADLILLDGTVSTRQLVVKSKTQAINSDPDMEDPEAWGVTASSAANGYSIETIPDAYTGNKCLRVAGYMSAYNDNPQNRFPIDPNKNYLLELVVRSLGGNARLYGVLRFYDSNGSRLQSVWNSKNGGNNYFPSSAMVGTEWTRFSTQIGPDCPGFNFPAGTAFVALGGLWNYQTSTSMEISRYRVAEVTDGEMIVEGSLTADHVGANEFITNSANIGNAVITDAHIANLSAATLTAGTALAGSITVSGTPLSTVRNYANNPASRINQVSTTIDPGKIQVSGSTTLADWRKGGDTTKIDGGAISANTVDANKLTIGQRGIYVEGITFSANGNTLSWTGGAIRHVNDDGGYVYKAIAAGSVTYTGSTQHVYWQKGQGALHNTTDPTSVVNHNDRLAITAFSGNGVFTNVLGRTVIDGDLIRTGAVNANHIEADAVRATHIRAGEIETNHLAAGAVTTEKLTVTNQAGNMVPDRPWGQGDFGGWTDPSGSFEIFKKNTAVYAETSTMKSAYVIRNTNPAGDPYLISDPVPIEVGDVISYECSFAIGGNTRNRNLQVGLRWYDANMSLISGNYPGLYDRSSPSYANNVMSGEYTAPDKAVYVRFWLRTFNSDNDGILYIDKLTARKKVNGSTIITPNSITADLVNAADFSASGLALFGGDLRSNNFNSGNAGWKIAQNGDAEFNNLIVRESIVVGAVSEGGTDIFYPTATHKPDVSYSPSTYTGPMTWDNVWTLAWAGEIRYGSIYTSSGKSGGTYYHRSRALCMYRTKENGVWSSWKQHGGTTWSNHNSTWVRYSQVKTLTGNYENVEIRTRHEIESDGSGSPINNVRNITQSVKAVVK